MLTRTVAILLALLVIACDAVTVPPPPARSEPPPAARPAEALADDMTAALAANPLPAADIFELVRRLEGRDGQPAKEFVPVRTTPPDEGIGTVREFWTYDFDAKRNVRVSAALRVITPHSKWWVATNVTADEARLRQTAQFFEERIYPTNRRLYGEEWSPGVDGDERVAVLYARIPGRAAGYFSSADALPTWVNQFSAEREMMYINAIGTQLATDGLYSVLAHEFCHMQQFNRRARSIVWFNEGQAQLCERANGFGGGFENAFLRQPDTQLNDWPELDDTAALHYGVAYLFLEFLRQQAGGDDLINAFLSEGIDTPADLDAVLRARGQRPLEELFADFVAANAFIGLDAGPAFAYPAGLRLSQAANAAAQDRVPAGGSLRSTVHQYAARYIELPRANVQVRFDGARATRVIPTDPHSGRAFWWSDRADGLDSTLTRTVDLRALSAATLSFWTWYDIEADFDYAYVAASTDGGNRWTTLPAAATTTSDPNGTNLGHGFTGLSGGGKEPAWVQQKVDLTPFAGREVQLRFQYVTDGALNQNGFALDDIEIAEAGYRDDAEAGSGWDAKGFIRSSNAVKQRYAVQVLRFGARPTVERHIVEEGTLELQVDAAADRRQPLLAVTGFAPRTTQTAAFTVGAAARP